MYLKCKIYEEEDAWLDVSDLYKKNIRVISSFGVRSTVNRSDIEIPRSLIECEYKRLEAYYQLSTNELFFTTPMMPPITIDNQEKLNNIIFFETKSMDSIKRELKKRKKIPYLNFYLKYLRDENILVN